MARGFAALLFSFLLSPALAPAASGLPPLEEGGPPVRGRVALIIDDLGKGLAEGRAVVALPAPVACAFLPHATYTPELARAAHGAGKEVMLHLPMQTVEPRPLDPGALRLDMTRSQFLAVLAQDMARVPHLTGINNHMGSLLTRHPGHMAWLMAAIKARGDLFFVDSRTTRHTVALRIAREQGVPSIKRDVFLDDDRDPAEIERQFERLLGIARRQGFALAIGHPYPETLALLARRLPALRGEGIELVPVRRLVQLEQGREQTWQASLSH